MDSDSQKFWQQVLKQLQSQMTQATFDAWFANTAARLENHLLTVYIPNQYAKEWLENRLFNTISQTVNKLAGTSLELQFEVNGTNGHTAETRPGSGEIAISLVSFDPMQRGYLVTPHYIVRFWQPYLGQDPFTLWFSLRSFGYNAEKNAWPSIKTLADICFNGNRHRILGRTAAGRSKEKIGALEILENERIVWVKREGKGRMTKYVFRVLESLPLLTPIQVSTLSPNLQDAHTRFIKQSEINLQEWEQLTLPTLLE